MLPRQLDLINNGTFIDLRYGGCTNDTNGKILIILGIIPEEKLCYMCNDPAVDNFNNYMLCKYCFNEIKQINNNKILHNYNGDRFVWTGKGWISEKHLDSYATFNVIKYKSKDPENTFRILQLGKIVRVGKVSCVSCWLKKDWPCGGCNNAYFYKDKYACVDCVATARYYFDLKLTTYCFLKILLEEDIAKYAVLYYFELKLRNC
jgi:hypothetical protein